MRSIVCAEIEEIVSIGRTEDEHVLAGYGEMPVDVKDALQDLIVWWYEKMKGASDKDALWVWLRLADVAFLMGGKFGKLEMSANGGLKGVARGTKMAYTKYPTADYDMESGC